MDNITMELVLPSRGMRPQMPMDMFKAIGATSAGEYAVIDGMYGKGGRLMGSLIKIQADLFTWSWDTVNNKLRVEPYTKDEKHVMVDAFEVTITGLTSGDTALFKTDYDAKEWLKTLSPKEQFKLKVNTEDYHGSAIMYLIGS